MVFQYGVHPLQISKHMLTGYVETQFRQSIEGLDKKFPFTSPQ